MTRWLYPFLYKHRVILAIAYMAVLVIYVFNTWWPYHREEIPFLIIPFWPCTVVPGFVYQHVDVAVWPYCVFYAALGILPGLLFYWKSNPLLRASQKIAIAWIVSLVSVSFIAVPTGASGVWWHIGYYPIPKNSPYIYMHGPSDPRYWVAPLCLALIWSTFVLVGAFSIWKRASCVGTLRYTMIFAVASLLLSATNFGFYSLQRYVSSIYDVWWTRHISYTPYAIGAALSSLAFVTSFGVFLALLYQWPRFSSLTPVLCPKCHYDLRGTAGSVCPECGKDVSSIPVSRREKCLENDTS